MSGLCSEGSSEKESIRETVRDLSEGRSEELDLLRALPRDISEGCVREKF